MDYYHQDGQKTSALSRSNNFIDLHKQIEGDHRIKCSTNESKSISQTLPNHNQTQTVSDVLSQNERYVNVDTQTSLVGAQFIVGYENVETIHSNSLSEEVNQQPNLEPEPKMASQNRDEFDNYIKDDELSDKVAILRKLLVVERQRNEQKTVNNNSMKQYLGKLQADYLTLQRDLLETLETCHKMKAQKDAQIELINETVKEKDRLINKLKQNLEDLNELKVREEFKELLDKQSKLAKLEKDQLVEQIKVIEQQLVTERVNNSQILQQFQNKLDQQLQTHEQEVSKLNGKISTLELELDNLLNEDKNEIIKNLREEKSRLSCQFDEFNLLLNESKTKHESMQKRLESLVREHELFEQKNCDELKALRDEYSNQKRMFNELKLDYENKEEAVQILQYNLQMSEKSVRNLLATFKDKEAVYNKMINELELNNSQELEKLQSQVKILERSIIENECLIDKKQNEIIKLELEHENQLESLKNDRDQRINKLLLDKQRVDKEIQAAELKIARQIEDQESKNKLIEQLQKEVNQFKDESKRLTIELTKSEAKLFGRQKEFDQFCRNQKILNQNNLNEQQQVDFELDQTKRHSKRLEEEIIELKENNERLKMKLKLHESSISEMNSAIKKEHAKMIRDYETKLEEIKFEQSVYDRNKIKYKRYGHKLKKYCDHLRQVHNHVCNSASCGYIISPMQPQTTNSTPTKRTPDRSSPRLMMTRCQNNNQLSQHHNQESFANNNDDFSSECESSEAVDKSRAVENQNPLVRGRGKAKENLIQRSTPICRRNNDKFLVKRIGGNCTGSPSLSRSARKPLQKSALSLFGDNSQLQPNYDDL